jgi:hypothetical protein
MSTLWPTFVGSLRMFVTAPVSIDVFPIEIFNTKDIHHFLTLLLSVRYAAARSS